MQLDTKIITQNQSINEVKNYYDNKDKEINTDDYLVL